MLVPFQYDVPADSLEYKSSQLYYVYKHTKCILSGVQGLAMLASIVENPEDGSGISLEELKTKGVITVSGMRACMCVCVCADSDEVGLVTWCMCSRVAVACPNLFRAPVVSPVWSAAVVLASLLPLRVCHPPSHPARLQRYFVLHDKRKDSLAAEWFRWCAWPWEQPIDRIRSYFVSFRHTPHHASL